MIKIPNLEVIHMHYVILSNVRLTSIGSVSEKLRDYQLFLKYKLDISKGRKQYAILYTGRHDENANVSLSFLQRRAFWATQYNSICSLLQSKLSSWKLG